jgi:hypothetical protein
VSADLDVTFDQHPHSAGARCSRACSPAGRRRERGRRSRAPDRSSWAIARRRRGCPAGEPARRPRHERINRRHAVAGEGCAVDTVCDCWSSRAAADGAPLRDRRGGARIASHPAARRLRSRRTAPRPTAPPRFRPLRDPRGLPARGGVPA